MTRTSPRYLFGEPRSTVRGFWAFATERHSIWLRRARGDAWPWTSDPILRDFRFCNVYRELDRNTIWFREHIRGRGHTPAHELFNTALFRWFNFIPSTEKLLEIGAFEEWDPFKADEALRGAAQWVTGAYIVKTPNGMSKLDGLLWCLGRLEDRLLELPDLPEWGTLYEAWEWLKESPYLGDFMAYEIVTDLRHTLLSEATDIMTWANPGPGCRRGLNRLRQIPLNKRQPYEWCQEEMQRLLDHSLAKEFIGLSGMPLEMREIEHTLCEFDKYERVRLGEGHMKNRYRRKK